MELKNIIKHIREQRGLSQEEFAAKFYVTRQAVSRWENGETTPNIDTLKAISEEYRIPASELLGLSDSAVCQSCGMDLVGAEQFGTNADGTVARDYCGYCFQKGEFTNSRTMEEMIESNLRFLDEYNAGKGLSFTKEQARTELTQFLATLKRWKE